MKRQAKRTSGSALFRCAIYTRKSSEEGLEQNFNSLHAQREACEAYVLSQAGEGWGALSNHYDDGGFSGGSMERPGLTQLLADVDAGRIDIVVVYKVDRLTRSLADFAKIVERFDARGVSFVSVTQAFNTTTSMGRLTLNVLLSFAQFEREVTGERIRDKIAQSKAKGMWMGGNVPLGYDTEGRALVLNPAEAEQVRRIFQLYLQLGSVNLLRRSLAAEGIRSKQRVTQAGKTVGGACFSRGALFYLLSNRHYLGEIVHKEKSYPGAHAAIVGAELFEAVQLKLAENAGDARRARTGLEPRPPAAPLAGLVFDDSGNAMSSVQARKNGRLYRYYVSTAIQQGRAEEAGSLPRFPGPVLEDLLRNRLDRLELLPRGDDLTAVIERIEVGRAQVIVHLDLGRGVPDAAKVAPGDRLDVLEEAALLTIPTRLKWRGGAKCAVGPAGSAPTELAKVDLTLMKALVRGEAWKAQLLSSGSVERLAVEHGVSHQYVRALIRLAFLSPKLKRAVLDGTHNPDMNLQRLVEADMPLVWADQVFAG